MTLPENFRTPRLLMARFSAGDATDLAAMHGDPRVAEMLGGLGTDADIEGSAQALAAHWDENGFGWWALREPSIGRFIGGGGLRFRSLGAERELELGFGFIPEFWGQGLATELARAAVAQGVVRLGATAVVGVTLPENTVSCRVMEKAGFAADREIGHSGKPHVLYRITAQAWRAQPVAQARSAAPPAGAEQAVAA